ncbi:acyl-CoA dehydrogenase family protein [Acidocella sp.]|uniref:acyl-CoA dehydrogenase family protein n=1 Tax=Acidocella sp. TaxID=50710 RepID=UPI00261DA97D|nr:acyl-CoA dehydrogenase family protein [Acidocella sp.]
MDFQLNARQQEFQLSARRFAQEELPEVARHCERTSEPVPDDVRRRMGELGFLGVNIPEEYGGVGAGKLDALLVLEEFAKISAAVAFPVFEANCGPAQTLLYFAPEWLKKQVLPKVCAGEMMVSVSMSEPDVGTAMTDLTTRAVIKDGRIIINGVKRWCSGAGHAQGYVLYCRLADKPGAAGVGAVYFEKDTPGVSFGKPEQFMGARGFHNAEIYLDDVEVPVENIIVPAGGLKNLMRSFNMERLGNATCSLGIAASALEVALRYTQERTQFGKPLVDFQAVQLRLAEMKMDVEASRLLIHRAAQNAEDGLPSLLDTSLAKCFANEAVRRVVTHGAQVMGACGYSTAYPMEQKMRDAWLWGIGGGHIDLQKVNITSELVGRRFSQR